MRLRQSGFTLVEMLVVTVLAGITLAAVYETLIVQEQTYRAGGAMIQDQESLRTALGILEAELREVGTIGGSEVGGSDIAVASADSVVFRAPRKIGFVCTLSRSDKWMVTYSLSDPFVAGDELMLFVDGDSLRYQDDSWSTATVSSVTSTSDAACEAKWPGTPLQKVQLTSHDLTGVRVGSPLRSYEWVTYGLYSFGPLGWGLGRHGEGDSPTFLVGGLDAPGHGLTFQYFGADGLSTTVGSEVTRMTIDMKTAPVGTAAEPAHLSSNLFLRNN